MNVEVINISTNELPAYETVGSAGMDLRADFFGGIAANHLFDAYFLTEDQNVLVIAPGGRALIPTNLFAAIPTGYEAQIRSRSGMALKHGVVVLNSPGTIDCDYRNRWGIILVNLGTELFTIHQGDRIAQVVFCKVEQATWVEVETLSLTARGFGGFGSTGENV
ncbi:MAG: dUTP diphosphatase [Candidatus Saccharimonadaceae bacterium]